MSDLVQENHNKTTATSVNDYSICPTLLSLRLHPEKIQNINASREKFKNVLSESAVRYETEVLKRLESEDFSSEVIPLNISNEEANTLTVSAMKSGISRIIRPYLENEFLGGRCSLFMKTDEGSSKFGSYFYYPILIKKEDTVNLRNFELELAFYAYLLELNQDVYAPLGIILDAKGEENPFRLKRHRRSLLASIRKIQKIKNGDFVNPSPCSHCRQCEMYDSCFEDFKNQDHVFIIPEIDLQNLESLGEQNIKTVQDIIDAPKDIIYGLKNVARSDWNTWTSWSKAYRCGEFLTTDNKPIFQKGRNDILVSVYGDSQTKKKLVIGVMTEHQRMPRKKNRELVTDHTRTYWFENDGRKYCIQQFFIQNDSEKGLIESFVNYISRFSPFTFYFYGDYAEESIYQLVENLSGMEQIRILKGIDTKTSDLQKVVKRCIGIPTVSYGNKEVCHFLRLEEQIPEKLGNKWDVLYAASKYVATSKPEYREELFGYNKAELISGRFILELLKSERNISYPLF